MSSGEGRECFSTRGLGLLCANFRRTKEVGIDSDMRAKGGELWVGSIYLKPELSQDQHSVSLQDFLRILPPTNLPEEVSGDSNSEISRGLDESGLPACIGRNGKTLWLLHVPGSRSLQVVAPQESQRSCPATCPRQADRRSKQIDFISASRVLHGELQIVAGSHSVLGSDHDMLTVETTLQKRRVYKKTETRSRKLVSEIPPVVSLDQDELHRPRRR